MATKQQLARIHILKTALSMSEDDYRAALAGFGVTSAKELSLENAELLIRAFERALPKNHPQQGPMKYNTLGIRYNSALHVHYATPKQLRMIEALWMTSDKVHTKTETAFLKFVKHITGKDRLEWLVLHDVQKIKKAIESLR